MRTIAGMVEQLGDVFDYWIITSDRDLGDTEPYPNTPVGEWVAVGKAHVYYMDMRSLSMRELSTLISGVDPDILYLNSLFSALNYKALMARRLGLLPRVPILVAPRGVFAPGALRLKQTKKRLFLQTARTSGLLKGLRWQASSAAEKRDIVASLPGLEEADIFVAADLAAVSDLADVGQFADLQKAAGSVRFVFLGRISAVKNLEYALTLLQTLSGQVAFDIYGPIEDPLYWERCRQIIDTLPQNVTVQAHGAIAHEEVGEALAGAHFLLFPTWGENFGHVILEALQVGRPVLISDQTSWNDLPEAAAGWVTGLAERAEWTAVLQHCLDMPHAEFAHHSESARRYARRWLASSAALEANKAMFLALGAQTAVQRP